MIRHEATSATMPLCRPRRWSQREGRTKKPAGVLDESSGLNPQPSRDRRSGPGPSREVYKGSALKRVRSFESPQKPQDAPARAGALKSLRGRTPSAGSAGAFVHNRALYREVYSQGLPRVTLMGSASDSEDITSCYKLGRLRRPFFCREASTHAYLSCAKPRRTGIPSLVSGRAGKANRCLQQDNSQL
jgi:hypothetical protein